MPLKNPSTNPVQAQTTKALMKKNYNIPKRRTKPSKNTRTIGQSKKGRKTLQNLLQPLITNNPDMSVSIRLDHQTQNRTLHLAFIGLPLPHLPKNHADLQSHLSFNGLPPTHHPILIIYRSRDDSEAIPNVLSSEWIKKEKFGLKAHCYGKAEDFMNKILRGEVFIDPKTIKFVEHRKFKALTKITGQDSY